MKQNEKFTGLRMNHKDLGLVRVIGPKKGSRTLIEVKILERGKGFDDKTNSFKGVKVLRGWYRGENKSFGSIDVVHVNELKKP